MTENQNIITYPLMKELIHPSSFPKNLLPTDETMSSSTLIFERQPNNSQLCSSLTPNDLRCIDVVNKTYTFHECIGKGTFGTVYRATVCHTGEIVAIKQIKNLEEFDNKDLVLKTLHHPNIIQLKDVFYIAESQNASSSSILNIVTNYVPTSLYHLLLSLKKKKMILSLDYVKYYVYQLARALHYIHSLHICHRDIKPQNILINTTTHELQLCDFGSAQLLGVQTQLGSYVCSRYYRAPELMLGSNNYTQQIDCWSLGCVFVELLLGRPLFAGSTNATQLVKIIKVLGTPLLTELQPINKSYIGIKLPMIKPVSWPVILQRCPCPKAIDLASQLLQFNPNKRLTPIEILCHSFFDDLRHPEFVLSDGTTPFNLFNFTTEELIGCTNTILEKLIPSWAAHYLSSESFNMLQQHI